jgi:hypothetical protein
MSPASLAAQVEDSISKAEEYLNESSGKSAQLKALDDSRSLDLVPRQEALIDIAQQRIRESDVTMSPQRRPAEDADISPKANNSHISHNNSSQNNSSPLHDNYTTHVPSSPVTATNPATTTNDGTPMNISRAFSTDSLDGDESDGSEEVYYASDVLNENQPAVAWTVEFSKSSSEGGGDNNSSSKPPPAPPVLSSSQRNRTNKQQQRQVSYAHPLPPPAAVPRKPVQPTFTLTKPAVEGITAAASNLTFAPKTNVSPSRKFGQAAPNVHERLTKYGEESQLKLTRAQEQRLLEQQTEASKITYKPPITTKGMKSRPTNPQKTAEMLFSEAGERDVVRECTKYHMMEAEVQSFPFKPSVNPARSKSPHVPIRERVGEVLRSKQDKLQRMRAEKDEEVERNTRATTSASASSSTAIDASMRLHGEGARMKEKALERVEQHEKDQDEQNTFKPALCKGTVKATSSYKNKPFLARQTDAQTKEREKRLKKEVLEAEEFRGYFRPDIGRSEAVLMKNRKDILAETDAEKIERLAIKDKHAIAERNDRKAAELYSQYNFEPTINNVSRALATRGSTTQELIENRRGTAAKQKAKREADEKFKEECTFAPNVRKSMDGMIKRINDGSTAAQDESASASVRINLSEIDNLTSQVARYQEYKEEVRREKLKEREIKELEQCTFKPVTNSSSNSSRRKSGGGGGVENEGNVNESYVQKFQASKKGGGAPVVVRGLGRYLELRNMANAKKKDEAEREAAAFKVKKASGARMKYPDGTTQIREFRLTQPNGELKEKMKKEREEQLKKLCTFQPDTIEKRNRRLINGLLEETEGSEYSEVVNSY